MTDEQRRRPVLIYLTDEERAGLQRRADREGRSLSQMGRTLLQPHLTPRRGEPKFEDPVEAARRAAP